MFDIGFWEILVIGVIALLVLGPERLPGAIRSTSRTIRNIKNMATGFRQEIEQQVRIQELHENLKKAEAQHMKNLSPELQESVNELKAAADSVNRPYQASESTAAHDGADNHYPDKPEPAVNTTNTSANSSAQAISPKEN